jgi:mannose-6-phosphate isomerase-like protein (cupin superfamily)
MPLAHVNDDVTMSDRSPGNPAHPVSSGGGLSRAAAQLAAEPWLWWPHVRYREGDRFYTRVVATEDYEAWLLTWLPGQQTGLHDHGGSRGAFAVVKGSLREATVTAGGQEIVRTLTRGRVRSFGPSHLHDVGNHGTVPAISLHVYAPALTAMTRYERVDGALRNLGTEAREDW